MKTGYGMNNMTFENLLEEQPELEKIKKDAVGWYQRKDDRWFYYEKLRVRMCKYVGWYAKESPLWMQTEKAYDVAHFSIFKEGQDFKYV